MSSLALLGALPGAACVVVGEVHDSSTGAASLLMASPGVKGGRSVVR